MRKQAQTLKNITIIKYSRVPAGERAGLLLQGKLLWIKTNNAAQQSNPWSQWWA